jgi:hypothetical protein
MKKGFIIFSGYNQRAVITFLRTLAREKIEFGIIASSTSDPIFDTAYAGRVFDIRRGPELTVKLVIESMKKVRKKIMADSCVIAPSTEALNRFLLENRGIIEKNGFDIPLVGKKLYGAISDKLAFTLLCRKNRIAVPGGYPALKAAKLPFAAKPKKYFSAGGKIYEPVLVLDKTERENFEKKYRASDFYFQEYVEGKSIYLLYYFSKDGRVYKYSQENLAQQPFGKSIIAAKSSAWHNTAESFKYERLFKKLGFTGLVMVEVRKRGNKFYMIEANPRFWGPSQLFVDAGINLFEPFIYDLGMKKEEPRFGRQKNARYFWYGGMKAARNTGKDCIFYGGRGKMLPGDISGWISKDIYNRADTAGIFKKETLTGGSV